MDAYKEDGQTADGADTLSACSFSRLALDAMPFDLGVRRLLRGLEAMLATAFDRDAAAADRFEVVMALADWVDRKPYGLDLRPMVLETLEQVCPQLQSPRLWEHLADARLARIGVTVVTTGIPIGLPTLERTGDSLPQMARRLAKAPIKSRACGAWMRALDWATNRTEQQLEELHVNDMLSLIRMLKLLVLYGGEDQASTSPLGQLRYFEDVGLPLWDALMPRIEQCVPSGDERDQELGAPAQLHLLKTLRERCRESDQADQADAAAKGAPMVEPAEPDPIGPCSTPPIPATPPVATHLIIAGAIPPASYKEDKEGLKAYSVLQQPLPVALLPDIDELDRIIDTLGREFPWATAAIDEIGRDLRARKLFGGIEMGMAPMLVVGPPGCGKSRLGRRIAEEFKLPFQLLAIGGSHDMKVITGTARGWGSAQAAPLLTLLAQRQSASAFVVLDEIDKAAQYGSEGKPLSSALLTLLEPESARRWHDPFLQTECDLGKVMFWATANLLSPIAKPLLSRLRVLYMPEPRREHFGAIADGVARDIAAEWGLAPEVLPQVDCAAELERARNVREVRMLVKRSFQDFAEAHLRRDRLH